MLLRRDLGSLLARLPWLGRPTTQRMCYPSASFRKGCMRRREFIAGLGGAIRSEEYRLLL
jgi:hypothetical protein